MLSRLREVGWGDDDLGLCCPTHPTPEEEERRRAHIANDQDNVGIELMMYGGSIRTCHGLSVTQGR